MKIFRYCLLLVAGVFGITTTTAQNSITPYSMYGYGMLNDNTSSAQRQMGGIGYAMNSGRQINVKNPASYASLDSLTFLWDMGADVSLLWSKEGSVKEKNIGGGLDYITMQFPIGKHMGGSAGLLPYSSVGYSFGNEIMHGTQENQGTGGITQAYIGLGGRYRGMAIGANLSYNFGSIINDFYAKTATTTTLFEHVMQIRDWNINIGAQYTATINKFNKITLGATYSPRKTLRGKTWVTQWDITNESDADTVAMMNVNKKYYQPNTIGVGLAYKHDRTQHIMIEADFTWQDWSKAKYSSLHSDDGDEVFKGLQFNDRWKVAVGGEYTPRIRGNYFQRIAYRLGGYYSRDYLKIGSNSLKEYGITLGFGLPTIEGKTIINLGFEWKRRTAYPKQLVGENYFNITLGVNFNELWFWQRKIK